MPQQGCTRTGCGCTTRRRHGTPDPIGLNGGMNRYAYVGGNALWASDERGELRSRPKKVPRHGRRNPKNGNYIPNHPKPPNPSGVPLPNPVKRSEAINETVENAVNVLDFIGCQANISPSPSCVPDDFLMCLNADCNINNRKFILQYPPEGPLIWEPNLPYPPSPNQVPEGCICKDRTFRRGMEDQSLTPPGL